MKLKVTRNQKSSMTGKTVFSLDFRAEVSPEEKELISKYRLGKEVVYSSEDFQKSMSEAASAITSGPLGFVKGATSIAGAHLFKLKLTVNDLVSGSHVEMKDLNELLSAELQIVDACQTLKQWLAAAVTFDGTEDIYDIDAMMADS
jgi:hypothetical protein